MLVKHFVASAWQIAFEQASQCPQWSHMLNPYFSQCMDAMLECLFDLETVRCGTFMGVSNAVNQTIEVCDHENLK